MIFRIYNEVSNLLYRQFNFYNVYDSLEYVPLDLECIEIIVYDNKHKKRLILNIDGSNILFDWSNNRIYIRKPLYIDEHYLIVNYNASEE